MRVRAPVELSVTTMEGAALSCARVSLMRCAGVELLYRLVHRTSTNRDVCVEGKEGRKGMSTGTRSRESLHDGDALGMLQLSAGDAKCL